MASKYTWDARNRLTSLSGFSAASFSYDAFGRRTSETIAGTTTGFQYDGVNRIAETSGGSTATMLTGGVDEFFQRTDSNGTTVPLPNPLGSILGMTDASGTLTTTYSYDPYGGTTSGGAGSYNTSEFTGRENDGTGLYYYRARYYNPNIGRFLSEDPIGFAGGINKYAYVGDSPVNFNDPTGWATWVTNRVIGGGPALPWWDPISHTFTFSTNPDGSISATYSWGNSANPTGWNFDQPEDMAAALQALQNGDAQLAGNSGMDPFYQQAFNQLNNPANNHLNLMVGRNCKTEATKLGQLAQQLYWSNLIQQWWQNFWQQIFGDAF